MTARFTALDPMQCHQRVLQETAPSLAFKEGRDIHDWQTELRARLLDLLGMPTAWDHHIEADLAPEVDTDAYTCHRIAFRAERDADVPGYLLKPRHGTPPFPLMICIQGHHKKDGMKVSLGRAALGGGSDFALQAVRNGWAALAIEQRCFGERQGDCLRDALHALMLGRTLTGERVFDVRRAVDFTETQPDLDPKRIGCMGNSAGGTVSFYAACVEPRIRLAVVSCSFCAFAESWLKFPHCACGYVPGIMKLADMGDLGGLIAPRNLIVVAGRNDEIAGLPGVEAAFARTRSIFRAAGCEENASLLIGEGGHRFYPDIAWPTIAMVARAWGDG